MKTFKRAIQETIVYAYYQMIFISPLIIILIILYLFPKYGVYITPFGIIALIGSIITTKTNRKRIKEKI